MGAPLYIAHTSREHDFPISTSHQQPSSSTAVALSPMSRALELGYLPAHRRQVFHPMTGERFWVPPAEVQDPHVIRIRQLCTARERTRCRATQRQIKYAS